jgi:hypothetical protein
MRTRDGIPFGDPASIPPHKGIRAVQIRKDVSLEAEKQILRQLAIYSYAAKVRETRTRPDCLSSGPLTGAPGQGIGRRGLRD